LREGVEQKSQCSWTPTPDPSPQGGGEKKHRASICVRLEIHPDGLVS
jgi:hypothetical protein